MDRAASAAWLAQITSAKSYPFHLLELAFDTADGGVQRFTDGYRNIVWGANTYSAVGYMLNFTDIEESIELQVNEITVSLSGVDQTLIAIILLKKYLNRTLNIYKGFWSQANPDAVVVDPIAIFEGRMDKPSIREDIDGTCIVTVKAANQWSDFERRPGRHSNHAEQQIFFPGDMFFQYTSDQNRQIVWGGPPSPGSGVTGGASETPADDGANFQNSGY